MLKKFSFALLLLACLAGCNSKNGKTDETEKKDDNTTAFAYNEDFVNKENSLRIDIGTTESAVSTYMANEQWDSIAIAGEKMERLIDAVIKDIKDKPAPDVKEGANFKDAGVRYFEFMKSMYTVYKDYGHETTAAGRDKQLQKLKDLSAQKQAEIDRIQSAQKKLADANGFKVATH